MGVCVCEWERVGGRMLCKPWSCQNRWEMGRAAACEGRVGRWRRMNPPRGYFLKGAVRFEQEKVVVGYFSTGCVSAKDAVF